MDIGNFVAVNAYVSSMFAPLNFLGYIYQSIIQGIITSAELMQLTVILIVNTSYLSYVGMVDVKNLSELLSQSPDIVDIAGARPIPVLSYRCIFII